MSSSRPRPRNAAWRRAGVAVVAALAVAGCANSTQGTAAGPSPSAGPGTTASAADLQKNVPSTQPGVTDTEIRVTSIGAITNTLGVDYTQAPKGTQAYFDMINSQGGIYGRKLVLVEQKDDQTVRNKETAQQVVAADEVFAVLPVTSSLFTGAQELADAGIPTFGWNINREWAGEPGLFGDKGSFVDLDNGSIAAPYLADKAGAKKVGILAYGIDQSKDCASAQNKAFDRWAESADVAFVDDTIPYGSTDYTVAVQKMRDAGVDFAFLCFDHQGAINLARELEKQGVDIPLLLRNAYEPTLLEEYGDLLDGSYVLTSFAPLSTTPAPKGIEDFTTWVAKVPGAEPGEQTVAGWVSADLFYRGLVAAGPEFTRASVIQAVNQITDWTADGIVPHIDWTKAHDQVPNPYCFAISKVENKQFVPAYGEPGKAFVCANSEEDPLNITFRT